MNDIKKEKIINKEFYLMESYYHSINKISDPITRLSFYEKIKESLL